MITDCHSHIDSRTGPANIEGHVSACENIDKCIVLAADGGSSETSNRKVSEYANERPNMVGFGVFNPLKDKPVARNIKSLTVDMGLEGVVLYCAEDGFHPADSRAMRVYEVAEELELPVFFHNCDSLSSEAVVDFARPYLLDEIARKFNKLKIVIGGMGLPFLHETLCMARKHKNVYADLTISPDRKWKVYNTVITCYEASVMDKLFFGSGYPDGNAGECVETLLGFNMLLSDAGLPTVPREEIRSVVERDTLSILGIDL